MTYIRQKSMSVCVLICPFDSGHIIQPTALTFWHVTVFNFEKRYLQIYGRFSIFLEEFCVGKTITEQKTK